MKETYNVEEVAEFLAVHKETVKKFIREGRIKGVKLGTRWRITGDEVKRILSCKKIGTKKLEKEPRNG